MPVGATPLPPHIFIIEDIEEDYNIVHDFVTDAIVGKYPRLVVERVYSSDDIEQRLSEIQERAKVLIIFDRLLETSGTSKVLLDNYISDLWNTDYTTWRGKIRIIVYSKLFDSLNKIRNKRRKHHFHVNKVQRGAIEPFDELQKAIQDCVNAL